MDKKAWKIKRMAALTIAVFATIFAVTFATLWLINSSITGLGFKTIGVIFSQAWWILALDMVLCVGIYMGYRSFLNSRK